MGLREGGKPAWLRWYVCVCGGGWGSGGRGVPGGRAGDSVKVRWHVCVREGKGRKEREESLVVVRALPVRWYAGCGVGGGFRRERSAWCLCGRGAVVRVCVCAGGRVGRREAWWLTRSRCGGTRGVVGGRGSRYRQPQPTAIATDHAQHQHHEARRQMIIPIVADISSATVRAPTPTPRTTHRYSNTASIPNREQGFAPSHSDSSLDSPPPQ